MEQVRSARIFPSSSRGQFVYTRARPTYSRHSLSQKGKGVSKGFDQRPTSRDLAWKSINADTRTLVTYLTGVSNLDSFGLKKSTRSLEPEPEIRVGLGSNSPKINIRSTGYHIFPTARSTSGFPITDCETTQHDRISRLRVSRRPKLINVPF